MSALGRQYFFLGAARSATAKRDGATCPRRSPKGAGTSPSPNRMRMLCSAQSRLSHDYDWKEAGEQFRLAKASESLAVSSRSVCRCPIYRRWDDSGKLSNSREKAHCARSAEYSLAYGVKCVHTLVAEMYEPCDCRGTNALLEFDDRATYGAHSVIAFSHFFQGKLAEAREPAEEAFHRAPGTPWPREFRWPSGAEPARTSGRRNYWQRCAG